MTNVIEKQRSLPSPRLLRRKDRRMDSVLKQRTSKERRRNFQTTSTKLVKITDAVSRTSEDNSIETLVILSSPKRKLTSSQFTRGITIVGCNLIVSQYVCASILNIVLWTLRCFSLGHICKSRSNEAFWS